jgi:enhancing lycopene biosynthesis protein 2
MNQKVAVILSGCGVFDGSEINEVVLTLLALETHHLDYQCFAPDIPQTHVIDHGTGQTMNENRNVLAEAARIVRGKVQSLSQCRAADFAVLAVPGGYGVAKNLSDFASAGTNVTLNPEFLRVCSEFKQQQKPAAYLCIAPALLPKIYGAGVKLTIGNDESTLQAITEMGGIHQVATVSDVVFDEKHRVLTTPAYMLATNLVEAKSGIDNLIGRLAALLRHPKNQAATC